MVVFLVRKMSSKTDVYYQACLRLNQKLYDIGGGLGAWKEWNFDAIRLEVTDDLRVDAELDFQDVDGRRIQVRVDGNRRARTTSAPNNKRRMTRGFLAPMGASIAEPKSLPLVYMTMFDLLWRTDGADPVIMIDGHSASPGCLPLERFLNRHIIKVAKDLCIVSLNPTAEDQDDKEVFGHLPKYAPGTLQVDGRWHWWYRVVPCLLR
jgi:hypothetical protein